MEKYLVGHQSELYEMLPIVLDHLRKKKFEDHFDLSSFLRFIYWSHRQFYKYNFIEALWIGFNTTKSIKKNSKWKK